MRIAVAGAGAFGTALAVALVAADNDVFLVGRNPMAMRTMADTRINPKLADVTLPENLALMTSEEALAEAEIVLLAMPAQSLSLFVTDNRMVLGGKPLVACCKGLDLTSLNGPAETIIGSLPNSDVAILTGPSFAADIAAGLPTALTLACANSQTGEDLQSALSTPTLRLYRSTDVTGAQLGGALKNVMAIACGATIGAGLGQSARAALMTRGFAEMHRLATILGARPETLNGLSGLGDLALTCTSEESRNFRFGMALGAGQAWSAKTTVEGAATAKAAVDLGIRHGVDLPITQTVAGLVSGAITIETGLQRLLSRPLKEE